MTHTLLPSTNRLLTGKYDLNFPPSVAYGTTILTGMGSGRMHIALIHQRDGRGAKKTDL